MTKRTIRGNDAAHLDFADSQLERRLLGPNECPVHDPEAARVRRSRRRCQGGALGIDAWGRLHRGRLWSTGIDQERSHGAAGNSPHTATLVENRARVHTR